MSALQHGEQLKGDDQSVSLDDLATCSRSLASTVGGGGNRNRNNNNEAADDDDSLAECVAEENYVITIKVAKEAEEQTPQQPQALNKQQPSPTAAPTIEMFTPEEFFKNSRRHDVPLDILKQQQHQRSQLNDLKARFEHRDRDKAVTAMCAEEVGKLPKSKVELYDSKAATSNMTNTLNRNARQQSTVNLIIRGLT